MSYNKIDLIEDLTELNKKKDKGVYIMIIDEMFIATTSKSEMDKYLISDGSMAIPEMEVDDITIIYGVVLDIENLPYNIDPEILENRSLWVIRNDAGSVIIYPHDTMEDVTDEIDIHMSMDEDMTIDDFSVLIGEELQFAFCIHKSGKYISAAQIEA